MHWLLKVKWVHQLVPKSYQESSVSLSSSVWICCSTRAALHWRLWDVIQLLTDELPRSESLSEGKCGDFKKHRSRWRHGGSHEQQSASDFGFRRQTEVRDFTLTGRERRGGRWRAERQKPVSWTSRTEAGGGGRGRGRGGGGRRHVPHLELLADEFAEKTEVTRNMTFIIKSNSRRHMENKTGEHEPVRRRQGQQEEMFKDEGLFSARWLNLCVCSKVESNRFIYFRLSFEGRVCCSPTPRCGALRVLLGNSEQTVCTALLWQRLSINWNRKKANTSTIKHVWTFIVFVMVRFS